VLKRRSSREVHTRRYFCTRGLACSYALYYPERRRAALAFLFDDTRGHVCWGRLETARTGKKSELSTQNGPRLYGGLIRSSLTVWGTRRRRRHRHGRMGAWLWWPWPLSAVQIRRQVYWAHRLQANRFSIRTRATRAPLGRSSTGIFCEPCSPMLAHARPWPATVPPWARVLLRSSSSTAPKLCPSRLLLECACACARAWAWALTGASIPPGWSEVRIANGFCCTLIVAF